MKTKKLTTKGFTIAETLVTLLAITIMLVGPISFVIKSFDYSDYVRSRVTATGLSQEGIELVTAIRNGVNASTFDTIANSCQVECTVDWSGSTASPVLVATGTGAFSTKLYTDTSTSTFFYRHSIGSVDTGYRRTIKITKRAANMFYVVSRVYTDNIGENSPIDITLEKPLFSIKSETLLSIQSPAPTQNLTGRSITVSGTCNPTEGPILVVVGSDVSTVSCSVGNTFNSVVSFTGNAGNIAVAVKYTYQSSYQQQIQVYITP